MEVLSSSRTCLQHLHQAVVRVEGFKDLSQCSQGCCWGAGRLWPQPFPLSSVQAYPVAADPAPPFCSGCQPALFGASARERRELKVRTEQHFSFYSHRSQKPKMAAFPKSHDILGAKPR